MVGKQNLWYLSFVHTSYVSVPIQTAQKFGKQTVSFQLYIPKFDAYTIIIMQRKIIVFWHQLLSTIIFWLFRTLVELLGIS